VSSRTADAEHLPNFFGRHKAVTLAEAAGADFAFDASSQQLHIREIGRADGHE
jgi:hypothetical protein